MSIKFKVPVAVRNVAEAALRLHRERPYEGVGGVAVAEALTKIEDVDATVVTKMRRFFTTTERHYMAEVGLSHRPSESIVMRSWDLHGGQAGKAWSDATHAQAKRLGLVEEDPLLELLRADPERVYEAFAMGAWRWEFDMDPDRAARFMESYHRATGVNLDVTRAFGSGRNAVATAAMRRAQNENPFRIAARNVMRDEYRAVVEQDLRAMKRAVGHAALNWPSFIASAALGVHHRDALRPIVEGFTPPPLISQDAVSPLRYSEPIADYVAYFHPRGSQFVANMPPGLLAEMQAFAQALHSRVPLDEERVVQVLTRARDWTASNDRAWNVGRLLLEAWHRRDWAVFEDAIPLGSPVRAPFVRAFER